VKVVLQSGIRTGDDKGKIVLGLALAKEAEFDLECTKETFMEAKKSFTNASTLRSKDRLELEMDPSMLTTFLEDMHEATA